MNEVIDAAERIESLGLSGALFLFACAFAYVIYRFILQEHNKILDICQSLIDKADRQTVEMGQLSKTHDKTNALFAQASEIQAESSNKTFTLAFAAQETTIKLLNEINSKLDRLLVSNAAKTPRSGTKTKGE